MSFDFEEFLKTHFVHQETIEFLKSGQQDGVRPYYEIGVEEARKVSEARAAKHGGSVELDGTETEISIPSPYDKGNYFIFYQNMSAYVTTKRLYMYTFLFNQVTKSLPYEFSAICTI